jgi:hypothetical protein
MNGLLKKLFVDKPGYQSVTAWGLLILGGAEVMSRTACEGGEEALLSAAACGTIAAVLKYIGIAVTALGLRPGRKNAPAS